MDTCEDVLMLITGSSTYQYLEEAHHWIRGKQVKQVLCTGCCFRAEHGKHMYLNGATKGKPHLLITRMQTVMLCIPTTAVLQKS